MLHAGPGDNLVKDKDVIHKTATLKDFKNPIYSAPGPDSTQNVYDGVYSETGTSKVGDIYCVPERKW